MATTTNYGWTTPDDTALVKDGAAAIRTLGSSIDTTTKNLNPSTTLGDIEYRSSTANVNTRLPLGTAGQVLKVNSGATAPEWSSDNAGMTNPMTTTGDTIYSSSGSTPARLGIGSTGQVLTVAGGVPTWAAPSSGSMTLLSTTSMSGASVTISSIDQTYRNLYVVVRNFLPATNNQYLDLKLNGGSTFAAFANYGDNSEQTFTGSVIQAANLTSNAADQGLITITIPDYANTVTWKMAEILAMTNSGTTSTSATGRLGIGMINTLTAITSLRFSASSGNLNGGSILVYGVK
jgi:hypothetical protein